MTKGEKAAWKAAMRKFCKERGMNPWQASKYFQVDYASMYSYLKYDAAPGPLRRALFAKKTKGEVPA